MGGPVGASEPTLVAARGARAAERWLLRAVREASPAQPHDLARAVRVMVPSASLREHVCAALVRDAGRPLLGVRVQTLGGVARELLERSGVRLRDGERLFPILVRRELERERALAPLAALRDADAAVAASVRDLLDAGLDDARAPALIAACGAAPRLRALVEVALRVAARLAELGFAIEGERARRAAAELRARGPALLPARAVLVHGFAEATGCASALLDALVEVAGARVVLDRPPDPLAPGHEDPSARFTDRLARRLGRRVETIPEREEPEREIAFLSAAGTDAEVRAVALRIRAELERGTEPERIALCARDLAPYAHAIRAHLGRLAIPFSGRKASGPPLPAGRRLRALAGALRGRGALDVDAWVELCGEPPELRAESARAPELRLGLHALGALTLGDVAGLDLERALGEAQRLRLPLVRGVTESDEDEPPSAVSRAWLSRGLLEATRARAQSALAALERWPARAALADRLDALGELARSALGWDAHEPSGELLELLSERLARELPAALPIGVEELARALDALCDETLCDRFGGEGAGVQVLEVMEARAHTWSALFVLGMNRGRFPRGISEDPLIPETWRDAGRAALPELPRKSLGHLEERYLYAGLCSSSPRLALSWQSVDDDGRALARSPLVERQLLAEGASEPEVVPPIHGPTDDREPAQPRPAFEHALRAALARDRDALGRALRADAQERGVAAAAARALASTRLAVLEELDSSPRAAPPGPYLGWVGPVRAAGDPRLAPLFVTRLEALARCPWQAFLSRILRLEAPPDALDLLPRLQGRAVGNAVHRALERIVATALGETRHTLEQALAREPVPVAWPAPDALEEILREACADAVRAEGIALAGLDRALAELARPYLERAHAALFEKDRPLLGLGVEVEGRVPAHGEAPAVRFKADLVELREGAIAIWDHKTGVNTRPFTPAEPDRQREQMRAGIASGTFLQAAAYTAACRASEAPAPSRGLREARGGYVFLAADFAASRARVACDPDDPELRTRLERSIGLLRRALERGTLFPRLEHEGGREPLLCGWCELQAACLRGDSGTRRRLREWGARGDEPASEDERTYRALWRMGEPAR